MTYTLFYDFKRYVLEPALRELHSLGWMVTYAPLKEGQKVQAVCFTIPKPHAGVNLPQLAGLPPSPTAAPGKAKAAAADK